MTSSRRQSEDYSLIGRGDIRYELDKDYWAREVGTPAPYDPVPYVPTRKSSSVGQEEPEKPTLTTGAVTGIIATMLTCCAIAGFIAAIFYGMGGNSEQETEVPGIPPAPSSPNSGTVNDGELAELERTTTSSPDNIPPVDDEPPEVFPTAERPRTTSTLNEPTTPVPTSSGSAFPTSSAPPIPTTPTTPDLPTSTTPAPASHVQEFSCGRLYYRTFYMDRKREVLFVGGMDKVFRLNLNSINGTKCDGRTLTANAAAVTSCATRVTRVDYECKNYIKVIQPIGDGSKLYICGTNANNPMDLEIYSDNLMDVPKEHLTLSDIGTGQGKCPYHPDDNSTAIWVEKGNPDDLPGIYSGTAASSTNTIYVIYRSKLNQNGIIHGYMTTIQYESTWLNRPHFVASFDTDDHVYYFFRENAIEYSNCGVVIYSRVARVCKRDTGHSLNTYKHTWTTFLKARLNCSIPGEYPFYFNEIQSVYKSPDDGDHIYAVFTTSLQGGPYASAVCSFHLSDIQDVFAGKFKGQKSSEHAWLPVRTSEVPKPRPGLCQNNTKDILDIAFFFIRNHPLMDSAVPQSVPHKAAGPVFYRENVVFLSLAVHKVNVDGMDYSVYYIGTRDGLVYKVVEWKINPGNTLSDLIDVFEASHGEPIRTMDISSVHKSLYVGSDDAVRQFSLYMCRARHLSCVRCIRDPYCGWDEDHNECKPYIHGYLQDVTKSTPGICEKSVQLKQIHAYRGESVYLSCKAHHPAFLEPPGSISFLPSNRPQTLEWIHYSTNGRRVVLPKPEKFVHSQDHALVVMALIESDAGRYDLHLDPVGTLCSYNITVN
ncbi:semaphorin-2A-like [Ornithodoros turicata]|uniref:semaphorin-2A-like n=1 Tax=Ornithodoros turicata TaxID=34597 RepID=UPI003139A359